MDSDLFPHPEGERLQKVLARTGFGSRRSCENLIVAERVTVNGRVAELGNRVSDSDEIAVDGTVISTDVNIVAYLLNKPAGVVTTASDPDGRPIVTELVPDKPRVFPVGRLDLDTEGLLLMTNDGNLANRLTHPSFGVEKEYLAHVVGKPSRSAIRQLREGVKLEDGMTAPAKIALVDSDLLKMTIHEGRNRQIRRMCETVGHPVKRLVRTRIGPLADSRLRPGQSRRLSKEELIELQQATGSND